MKKFILFLGIVKFFLIFSPLYSYAQGKNEPKITEDEDGNVWVEIEPNPFYEAIMHPVIDVENGEIDDCFSTMYSISLKRFGYLLKNDIVGYNGLENEYKTDLQKEEFKKSKEYELLAPNFKEAQECVKRSDFCILYNLRHKEPYNVSKKAFVFSFLEKDFNVTSKSGYIGLGSGVCVTSPLKYTQVSKVLFDGKPCLKQSLTLPYKDTRNALRIEKDMENPNCSTYLVFKVRIQNMEQEKRMTNFGGNVGTMLFPWNYLLCKTVGIYIVNRKTEEVLGDFSNLLK